MFITWYFWYNALVIVLCGILAISLRNPVHSVLAVLVLFFHMAGLYLLLQAEFLAAVQVIVYAGAILVLYLFVLFLVNLKEELRVSAFVPGVWLGRGIAVTLAGLLLWAVPSFVLGEKGGWPSAAIQQTSQTKALGMELFTAYLLPFEIAGVLLLVALIGGLVLASKNNDTELDAGKGRELPSQSSQVKEVCK